MLIIRLLSKFNLCICKNPVFPNFGNFEKFGNWEIPKVEFYAEDDSVHSEKKWKSTEFVREIRQKTIFYKGCFWM